MKRRAAFTLMELLLVIVLIAVVAAMLLPANSGPHRRQIAQRINCVNNLKQVDLAFKIWGGDHDDRYPIAVSVTNGGAKEFAEQGMVDRVFQVMSNEVNAPKILHCPVDTTTVAATNFINLNNGNLSYFIGIDATEENPQAILLGDDNLVINGKPVSSGRLNLSTNDIVEWGADRHHRAGNIALADGSVQQATSGSLRAAIFNAAMATNRWVIP